MTTMAALTVDDLASTWISFSSLALLTDQCLSFSTNKPVVILFGGYWIISIGLLPLICLPNKLLFPLCIPWPFCLSCPHPSFFVCQSNLFSLVRKNSFSLVVLGLSSLVHLIFIVLLSCLVPPLFDGPWPSLLQVTISSSWLPKYGLVT